MTAEVDKLGDAASLSGKQVKIVGMVGVNATGKSIPRPKPVTVQPVTVTAA